MRREKSGLHENRTRSRTWLSILAVPVLVTSTLSLTGCGEAAAGADVSNANQQQGQQGQQVQQGQGNQSAKQGNYPEIKSMVLDILHSKEGMATLQDTMSSPEFKRATAITDGDIQAAVEKTLGQGQNKHFLAEQMKDTKFAAAVVTAAHPDLVAVQRQLMTDPSYQKDLLTLMESPEFQQTQLALLKSPEYRKEVMKIMTEALAEPTFRLLFMDSMKEAVQQAGGGQADKMGKEKEKGKGKDKDKDKDKKEQGQDSGKDKDKGGDEGGGGDSSEDSGSGDSGGDS